jgi:hypothetical protein
MNDLSSPAYLTMSASQKLERLWGNIMVDTTSGTHLNKVTALMGLMSESMEPSFTTIGDTFKNGRRKLVHSVGVVGKVVFTPAPVEKDRSHGYTGCFQGVHYGLLRLSSTLQPGPAQPLIPGLGLKFLRDGRDSANIVALQGIEGQPDNWNFFAHSMTTTLPTTLPVKLDVRALSYKFATATDYPYTVGLQDIAAYDQSGMSVETPRFPNIFRFQPHCDVATMFPVAWHGYSQYVDQLANIPSNTRLFDVYAQDQPHGTELLVGTVQLVGGLTRSRWADERLYFRHQKKDDDLAVCPLWKQSLPKLPTYAHIIGPIMPLYQYPSHWVGGSQRWCSRHSAHKPQPLTTAPSNMRWTPSTARRPGGIGWRAGTFENPSHVSLRPCRTIRIMVSVHRWYLG